MRTCLPASIASSATGSWVAGGGADVDDVDVRQHGGEARVRRGAGLTRERVPLFGGGRRDGGQARVDAVDPAVGEQVQVGGEARADDADAKLGDGRLRGTPEAV